MKTTDQPAKQDQQSISPGTDFQTFLGELDAGVFEEKLSAEISKMALAVVTHGRAGKMVITIDMKQIGHHNQVNIAHKMQSTVPSLRGKKIEEDVTESPMHVGKRGKLSFFPDNQIDFLKPTNHNHNEA